MKILFVEDEYNAVLGLINLLNARDNHVDVVETADAAIRQLGTREYDLILLDTMLPPGLSLPGVPFRETGKELLLRLRSGKLDVLEANLEVPVLVITAVSDMEINTELNKVTNVRVIHKPISPEDALLIIENFVMDFKNGEF